MSAEPLVMPVRQPPVPARRLRVEYLGFQNVAEQREFRFRVDDPDGSREVRFGIANSAFGGGGRLMMQDGPDVCYQKLLQTIAAGESGSRKLIAIDDVDLARYREAHTHVPKRRARPAGSPITPPVPRPPYVPRVQARTAFPQPVAPPPVPAALAPGLDEGQRVRHAIFGDGVTAASSPGHTAVCFDEGGKKTFVTSMLVVDLLSAPHTWQTGRKGTNRLRKVDSPPADVPGDDR